MLARPIPNQPTSKETTMDTQPDPIRNLEQAVRQLVTGLRNAAATRKAHPTYGITKADLRVRLAQVEGAAFALGSVTDDYVSASPRASASRTLDRLGYSLGDLHDLVRNA